MNYTRILKRAWEILWSYRTLWVFGVLLALTAGGGGNGSGFNYSGRGSGPTFNLPPDVMRDLRALGRGMQDWFSRADVGAFIGLGAALLCLILLLTILGKVVNYVSQAALMRMVDGLEARGEKVSWREGFRLGWSRAAWRLFLLDLLVYLPLGIVFIGLFGCALLPVIISAAARGEPSGAAIFGTVILILPLILLVVIIGAAVSLVMNLARRQCVLGDKGVVESLRLGVALLRRPGRHLVDSDWGDDRLFDPSDPAGVFVDGGGGSGGRWCRCSGVFLAARSGRLYQCHIGRHFLWPDAFYRHPGCPVDVPGRLAPDLLFDCLDVGLSRSLRYRTGCSSTGLSLCYGEIVFKTCSQRYAPGKSAATCLRLALQPATSMRITATPASSSSLITG